MGKPALVATSIIGSFFIAAALSACTEAPPGDAGNIPAVYTPAATPDLTGYVPPPGCVLDRIYEKDGYVWSEFLNVAIRPVVETTDEGSLIAFPVQAYPDVLNCHDSAQTVNPYVPPAKASECRPPELRVVDGWVASECGRLRPDIPMIDGGGDQVILSYPLGEEGIIIVDYPPVP